tara:strand:- start:250 stop:936 length:687 start_codon:yes stop_codon:yes gene_type:complete
MKKIIISLIPPIILSLYRNFKKKLTKKKFFSNPEKQELDLYYDKDMAKILDTWGERNVWIEVQHLFQEKKSKTLDIACGTGKVIEILNKNLNHNEVYGCDISDFLIGKALERGIDKEKLQVCDATNLPYKENEFEFNYSIGSLEHFTKEGILKFLKESKRVTQTTGYHLIPVSRSGKDEGWITNYQSYFNNSLSWWTDICKKEFKDISVLDSGWDDEISVGKWLILKK